MLGTDAIKNMIREGKTHQVPAFLEAGAKYGMITMDRALYELMRRGHIAKDTAIVNAKKPEEFKKMLAGGGAPGMNPMGSMR